jgi:FMN phosphatase YigB (HAD superfamily)
MQAILFDLDGTLIDDSMETFLPPYFTALCKKLSHRVPPEKLIAQLQASTRAAVMNNDHALTIADAFAADFFPKIGIPAETLMPLFDDFYVTEYPKLRALVKPIPLARCVIERAIGRGKRVVIATMPVFPRTAIWQRMAWGGIADLPYALVTDYETMHASKPHSAYYREIAARLGIAPTECLMVGNEIQNDIVPAKQIGMKTFWVTRDMNTEAPADWRGTLQDVHQLLDAV